MTSPGRHSGFTLVEVVVVTAIIAILAGIMVPMVYRVWENADRELTVSRLADLRTALLGDGRLFQNGVRTSFGYVGDMGELPPTGSLAWLKDDPGGLANWRGHYLPAGFDPADYARDGWGQDIDYLVTGTDAGRNSEAVLTSRGPDGVSGTADDLSVAITAADVLPLTALEGNVQITFPSAQANRSIGVVASYRDGSGNTATATCCDVVRLVSGGTGSVISQYFSCALPRLPQGVAVLTPKLYDSAACATPVAETARAVAVAASSSIMFVNLQLQ
jgi:prepilin-type N-terminal cleavage/methylation domain-containing protein